MSEPTAGSLEQRLLTLYEQSSAEEQEVLAALFEMAAQAEPDDAPLFARPDADVEGFTAADAPMLTGDVVATASGRADVARLARKLLATLGREPGLRGG